MIYLVISTRFEHPNSITSLGFIYIENLDFKEKTLLESNGKKFMTSGYSLDKSFNQRLLIKKPTIDNMKNIQIQSLYRSGVASNFSVPRTDVTQHKAYARLEHEDSSGIYFNSNGRDLVIFLELDIKPEDDVPQLVGARVGFGDEIDHSDFDSSVRRL